MAGPSGPRNALVSVPAGRSSCLGCPSRRQTNGQANPERASGGDPCNSGEATNTADAPEQRAKHLELLRQRNAIDRRLRQAGLRDKLLRLGQPERHLTGTRQEVLRLIVHDALSPDEAIERAVTAHAGWRAAIRVSDGPRRSPDPKRLSASRATKGRGSELEKVDRPTPHQAPASVREIGCAAPIHFLRAWWRERSVNRRVSSACAVLTQP
jgi:hypothetical protein